MEKLIDELVKKNLLGKEEAQRIIKEAKLSFKDVEDILYQKTKIPQQKIAEIKSQLLNIPYKQFDVENINKELLNIIPENIVSTYQVIPLEKKDNILVVGMVHPDNEKAQKALEFIASSNNLDLGVYLVTPKDVHIVLRKYSPYQSDIEKALKSIRGLEKPSYVKTIDIEEAVSIKEEAPVIKIVASTLKEAVQCQSSDVHIEPQKNYLRVRFRIDGKLKETTSLPLELHHSIISRVKVLANLKIDETRIPQDGRFRTTIQGKEIDFRISTFPTPLGEKVAIRILDPSVGLKGLYELGLERNNLDIVLKGLKRPYGMILITGPTGCGKTTTLYALLQELNKEEVNIVSLEDPVEYFVEGINQSQVKPEIGYTFASGLRQIVRQDPDIIMVGEIRDTETASLAIQAALTGHLVLSTLHTNNAIGAIPRLLDLKIEPFLLPAALSLVIAQRLVPCLCPFCKKEKSVPKEVSSVIDKELEELPEQVKDKLKFKQPYTLFYGEGCPKCQGKGIKGRTAIFEAFHMTPQLSELIIRKEFSEEEAFEQVKKQGMLSLRQDGIIKALEGKVPLEDVLNETREM